ncbi:MAG: hypothetical protein KF811_04935 [Dokdonella sp.]|nr:hypothetical protein [Dokdonella sp.]
MNAMNSQQARCIPAAILSCRNPPSGSKEPARVQLMNADLTREAIDWTETWLIEDSSRVHLGLATVLETREGGRDELILLDWKSDSSLDLLALLPETICPVEGTVAQVREVVANLKVPELRNFVLQVFELKDVFKYFWTCPASIRNHHEFAGGLAVHSLEVVTAVTQLRNLGQTDLCIAIVYALLHDVGKIWSYENGTLTAEAAELGHEHLGLERMLPSLQRLRRQWPKGGLVLHGLFSGGGYREDKRRGRAIGKIVRSLDAFSAEKYMARPKSQRFKS